MKTVVYWTLMFRVSTREKAEKQISRAREILGGDLTLTKCERYWKIPELWRCEAETVFESSSPAEQIGGCLGLANKLANGWHVLGPHMNQDGVIEAFVGIFARREQSAAVQSLEWAEFQLGEAAPSKQTGAAAQD